MTVITLSSIGTIEEREAMSVYFDLQPEPERSRELKDLGRLCMGFACADRSVTHCYDCDIPLCPSCTCVDEFEDDMCKNCFDKAHDPEDYRVVKMAESARNECQGRFN